MMTDIETTTLTAKWNGQLHTITIPKTASVSDVKELLFQHTNVLPAKQKFIGFIKGKLPSDETSLDSVAFNTSFMLMGTAEKDVFKDPSEMNKLPEVVDDLDYDFLPDYKSDDVAKMEVNQQKLREYAQKTEIRIINPLRPGKKLLVLDIDYTIYDMKGTAGHIDQLTRPFLHEFLQVVYQHYDLAFWSQTSHWALEAKLTEMRILTEHKVSFVLDKHCMFHVKSKKAGGSVFEHQVKALGIIWEKIPHYTEKNTIHIDDLGRNFVMNPKNGIKISAFKDSYKTRAKDRELLHLAKYLLHLALNVEDFSAVDHRYWKEEHTWKK